MTVKAVSEWLEVKPSTVYLWAEQGTIPHLKLGRLLRFDSEELAAWLHAHRREFKPQPPRSRWRRRGVDHVDDLIAQAKDAAYTPARGKPDQDRATGKGEKDGSV